MKKLLGFLLVALMVGAASARDNSYQTLIYTEQGGAAMVLSTGASMTFEAGSLLTLASTSSLVQTNVNLTEQNLTATYGVAAATAVISNTGATALTVAGGITAGTGVVGIVDANGKIPALNSTYLASLSGSSLTTLTAANIAAGSLASGVIASSYAVTSPLTAASGSFTGAITAAAVNVSGSGQVLLGNATSTEIKALAPGQAKGAMILNSTTGLLCISTATVAGSWVKVSDAASCW